MIIDTHCHLDHKDFFDDIELVLDEAKKNGIEKIIIPGADPIDIKRAVMLCEKHEQLFFSVGVHPYEIEKFSINILKEYAFHDKCVAIGECGLDYFRLPKEHDEKERVKKHQKGVFIEHIEFAKSVNLPLIVHIRDANEESKNILLEYNAKTVGGVLHCFNADSNLLYALKDSFYFGIGGVLTFKNAKKLVEILPHIPLDRLLFETDAPYLTPEPFRGRRNEPKFTKLVLEKASSLLNMDSLTLEQITTKNSYNLFKKL
ncbi:MAG: TatD family hydrolase [Campylobacterales bacterium]|nr:TatD family hydrolase [Campylobacterales bacterium]